MLALLAAIGAIVLPAAEQVRRESAWSAEQIRMQAVLAEARVVAIEQGRPMLVHAQRDGRLVVRPHEPATAPDDPPADPIIDVPCTLQLPEDAADAVMLAVLYPDGQSKVHAPIVLLENEGRRVAMGIDPLTGALKLLDLQPVEQARQEPLEAGT